MIVNSLDSRTSSFAVALLFSTCTLICVRLRKDVAKEPGKWIVLNREICGSSVTEVPVILHPLKIP